MFKRIGDFFSTIGNNFRKLLPTFLSVVAIITIIDYLTSRQGIWYLPILAITTGIMAIVLPMLCSRFNIVYSIVSTGWAILLIQTIFAYITIPTTFAIALPIFLVAIITDLCLGHFSISDLIFNLILSVIATKLIPVLDNVPLATVITLLVTYALVITVKLNVFFSLKRKHSETVIIEDTTNE